MIAYLRITSRPNKAEHEGSCLQSEMNMQIASLILTGNPGQSVNMLQRDDNRCGTKQGAGFALLIHTYSYPCPS